MGSAGRLLGALVGLLLLQGCPSGNELGGTWRPVLPTSGALVHHPITGDASLGIELVLGHYGPDVAGVMRFYRSTDYDLTRDWTPPDFECACLYLHKGRYGATSSSFEFVTNGCLPGIATQESVFVRGTFKLDQETRLVGQLRIDDPASTHDGLIEELIFTRTASAGSTLTSDFTCGHTDDADAGNTHSGK